MRRTKWHSNIKKQGTKMNITDYKNELILMFAILFMGLLALCWNLAMYKKENRELKGLIALYRENTALSRKEIALYEKIQVMIKNTNNDLEKSLKKSKRIKLGKNKNGDLLLELYDKEENKKVFVFENGLIMELI